MINLIIIFLVVYYLNKLNKKLRLIYKRNLRRDYEMMMFQAKELDASIFQKKYYNNIEKKIDIIEKIKIINKRFTPFKNGIV